MNVYALYFIDLLAPDSASICAQIHLPVKSSVPKSHVFDASANWEQSGTGTESIYRSHQLSLKLQLLPSESRWELPCPACVAFHLVVMEDASHSWFRWEKHWEILLNLIIYTKFQRMNWKLIIYFRFNLKTPHACGFTYRCWHFPGEIPCIQKWVL